MLLPLPQSLPQNRTKIWPLPPLTRALCLLTLLVSIGNAINLLPLRCAAPAYTIDRLELLSLLLSPFNILINRPSLHLLASIFNIFTFAAFEIWFRNSQRTSLLVLLPVLFLPLISLRVFLGYLFTRLTGWYMPPLFFHEALHECSQGLSPILFALLMLRSALPDLNGKYLKRGISHASKGLHQGFFCLLNCAFQPVFWWSATGLLIGWIGALVMHTQRKLRFKSKYRNRRFAFRIFGHGFILPSSGDASLTLRRGLAAFGFSLMVLLVSDRYYTQRTLASPEMVNSISTDPNLLTFIVLTAPRQKDPPLLIHTIDSYIKNLPESKPLTGLYSRIHFVVYTHFTNHTVFDMAQSLYSSDPKASQYISWVREEGTEQDQRLHLSKALQNVTKSYRSTYTAVLEDDFPVCDGRWQDILDAVYRANLELPSHCGLFVGTGGSGLIFKQKYAELASRILLDPAEMNHPPDVALQNCLLGEIPSCSACKDNLVISRTLLMYHIGYNASTSENRTYFDDEYQCGWRHPFNGNTHVLTF